jgi:hypothetical protein
MDTVRSEQLVLANCFDELKRLQRWVETLSVRMELSQKAAFQLDLVLSEAVTNIISYAYEDESDHVIVVRLINHRANAIVIELIDDGKPFNPLAVEIPQFSSELATVSVDRRGSFDRRVHGYLSNQPFYCGVPYSAMEPLLAKCSIVPLEKGAVLLSPGQANHNLPVTPRTAEGIPRNAGIGGGCPHRTG